MTIHPFISGVLAGIITGAMITPVLIKEHRLDRVISVEVIENGNLYHKSIKVRDLIQYMKDFDCEPFTVKEILKAKRIKTVAICWVYTSYELKFYDGSSIKRFAFHGSHDEMKEFNEIFKSLLEKSEGDDE